MSIAEGIGLSALLAHAKELRTLKRLFNKLGGFPKLGMDFEDWVAKILNAKKADKIVKDGIEITTNAKESAIIDFIIDVKNSILEVKLSGSAYI